jgi:exodeoxyribonuclease VII large subunit
MDITQSLRNKRQEIADREGKPLYMVFQNATLEATAKVMPKTKEELESIKGWGPKRIDKYGDEIIKLIQNTNEVGGSAGNNIDTILKEENTFTVSEFLAKANSVLSVLSNVRIRGEISDVNLRQDMAFFDLKDASGKECVVKCFVGSWDLKGVEYSIEAGLEVLVQGTPRIFERYGKFSMTVRKVEPIGEGALKKEFEALKNKLEEKGYFDVNRKRTLPVLVRNIGLITSAQGDAVNDFKRNLGMHGFVVRLIDVRVEGEYAESQIENALGRMNANYPECDVIVLIRGGGGLENLKAFNSERIAEAIIASRIPILTGVGHEQDFTIADYVADIRASTPTGSAVMLRKGREDLIAKVCVTADELRFTMERINESMKKIIEHSTIQLISIFDKNLEQRKVSIDRFGEQMQYALSKVFEKLRTLQYALVRSMQVLDKDMQENAYRIKSSYVSMCKSFEGLIESSKSGVNALFLTLNSLSPDAVLKRGYSVAYNKQGVILRSTEDVKKGDTIGIRLCKGRIEGDVKRVLVE